MRRSIRRLAMKRASQRTMLLPAKVNERYALETSAEEMLTELTALVDYGLRRYDKFVFYEYVHYFFQVVFDNWWK